MKYDGARWMDVPKFTVYLHPEKDNPVIIKDENYLICFKHFLYMD
jgi:hypothetical protein